MIRNLFVTLVLIGVIGIAGAGYYYYTNQPENSEPVEWNNVIESVTQSDLEDAKEEEIASYPTSKTLINTYHVYQTFNNCGPASLSMALSYFDINVSQKELGDSIRPYQIANGDNDDKSSTLQELANKAQEYDLIAYHRPNGDMELIKGFIANDIPVIARTWLKENDDIGHYRVIKGYNEVTKEIVQDDSYEGKNLIFSYDKFNAIWKKFNYEYLVLVPESKKEIAEKILGGEIDPINSWEKAVEMSEKDLQSNPDDVQARFNLSVALFNIGRYEESAKNFELIEGKLNKRALWYQTEPIEAYYKLGNYDRVFSITDNILNNGNRAYSEAYLLRGDSYLKLGDKAKAKAEYEKAVLYNKNLKAAKDALASVD